LEKKYIENMKVEGYGCRWNYTGMVCSIRNKPHGFGRAIDTLKSCFYDGVFKDGVFFGSNRIINFDG
jgi:hypothetical protein